MLKKLFGGINLNWKKLILFSVIIGVYAGIMFSLPFTINTSFVNIALKYECWILFVIIIMANSKSPMDSALKCSVFFAISQPLIYLVQISFGREFFDSMRFVLYGGWIFFALLAIPLGYVGYYIKRKDVWSLLILSPALFLLTIFELKYLREAINYTPHSLFSAVICFAAIILITFGIFYERKLRILSLSLVGLILTIYLLFFGGIIAHKVSVDLSEYGVVLNEDSHITFASYYPAGEGEIVKDENGKYKLNIVGYRNGNYQFTIVGKNYYDQSEMCHYDVECKFDAIGNFSVSKVNC